MCSLYGVRYVCVCVYIYINTHVLRSTETLVGRKNKIETAVNTACEGNISACHFGQACHRLVIPSTEHLSRHSHCHVYSKACPLDQL